MADKTAPVLELRRITKTDGVVLDRLPGHEQSIAARFFDRASQLHTVAALRALENWRSLFHRGFEFGFQAGLDLDLRNFGNHRPLRARNARQPISRAPRKRRASGGELGACRTGWEARNVGARRRQSR